MIEEKACVSRLAPAARQMLFGHPPGFCLTIPDEMARKMTRKEYYAARRWLRQCTRIVAAEMSNKLGQTQ